MNFQVNNDFMVYDNKHSSKFMFIHMALLCALLAFHNVLGLNINQYLILGFAAVIIPFLKLADLLAFTAFIIPLSTGINAGIFLVLTVALLFRLPKIAPQMVIFPCLLIAIEIWDIMDIPNLDYTFKDVAVYSGYLLIFFILLFVNTDTELSKRIIRYFIVGMAILCLIYVLRLLNSDSLLTFVSSGERMGENVAESQSENIGYIVLNANTLGYFSAVGISLCLLGKDILKLKPIILALSFIVFLIAGGATISRTWAMTVALALTFYFFRSINRPRIWITAILGVWGILWFDLLPETFVEAFTNRFMGGDMESGNGRIELFEKYNEFMADHPEYLLFGITVTCYKHVAKIWNSTHNGIQQIYLSTGIAGLLLFVIATFQFYRKFILPNPGPLYRWMPFIIAAIFLQSIQFLNPHILMLPIVITTFTFKISGFELNSSNYELSSESIQ